MSQNNLPVKKIKYPVAEPSFDLAYYETDEYFEEIVAELESVYGQAYVELKEIAEEYLQHFIEEDKIKREQFQNGTIEAYEYNRWRENAMMTGRYHYAMLQNASDNLANKNALAISIINGYMPSVYATNGNYIFYEVEKKFGINASFTIFNEEAVERIIREKPDLIPRKANLNIPKDKQWNKQNINSAIMQGIIQGETIDAIAERLARVSDMNYNSAVRNATTMICSAQNGGRMDSYRRCQSMGIKLKHRWLATLDGHTRMSHRALDGEVRAVDEEFSNGLLFPGDPSGEPREIYNCRCVTIPAFEDSKFNGAENRASRLPSDMSYDEWKNAKGVEPFFKAAQNVNADMRMHDEYLNLYKNYKGSFTNAVPKNFRDFQDLKYNDPTAWEQMVSDSRKARNQARKTAVSSGNALTNSIKNNNIPLDNKNKNDIIDVKDCYKKVKESKQREHILGDKRWVKESRKNIKDGENPKSFLYKNENAQKLVDTYSGKGEISYRPKNKYPIEYVNIDHIVGKTFDNKVGKYVETRRILIMYSSKGTHICPVLEKEE